MRLPIIAVVLHIACSFPVVSETRTQVLDAQIYLNALGYNAGAADGVWGRNTATALNNFLSDQDLPSADELSERELELLRRSVESSGVQVSAARIRGGQPYDPTWPTSEWHPDMRYDQRRGAYAGGFFREGWVPSGTLLPHQFNLVSDPYPVRYGDYSERFEIRPNDDSGMNPPTSGNRSELQQRPHPDNGRIGEDNWYGWSFYHENIPWLPHTYGWFPMFGQWKTDLWAPPVISIGPAHDGRPGTGRFMGVRLDDLSQSRGREWASENLWATPCRLFLLWETAHSWVDIVVNTNFGDDENGYLNIWINDELKCEYRGQITVTPVDNFSSHGQTNRGPIFKRGYWSGHWSFPDRWRENHPDREIPTFIVYYDEWRQGSSREEVDIRMIEARGGEPLD